MASIGNLQLWLDGPYILWQNSDSMDVFALDLLDSHEKPGFTATENEMELTDNGIYTLDIGSTTTRPATPVGTMNFDQVDAKKCNSPSAYAILQTPLPDEVWRLNAVQATVRESASDGFQMKPYCSKLVLRYLNIDLQQVEVNGFGGGSWVPIITPIGGEGVLTFDMQPLDPANIDHASMVSRAKAQALGIQHFVQYNEGGSHGVRIFSGPHNDCHAVQLLVV